MASGADSPLGLRHGLRRHLQHSNPSNKPVNLTLWPQGQVKEDLAKLSRKNAGQVATPCNRTLASIFLSR